MILVAEDEQAIRDMYSSYADFKPGLGIRVFKDGNELYRAATTNYESVDRIITDWSMPGMDGLQFTINFREYERTRKPGRPPIPITMISGSASNEIKQAALKAGVTKCLEKNGDYIKDLEAAIRQSELTGQP